MSALELVETSEDSSQLRCIFEHTPDIIGIIDAAGRLQFHSPSAERILQYQPHELSGRLLTDFVHEDDRLRAVGFFQDQFTAAALPRTIDLRIRHRDGAWRRFSVRASAVVRDGRAVSVVISARDTTERLLLEAQLEKTNRMNSLANLVATLAHEFNNVLMGIQPFADLMQRPDVPPEAIAKGARHIASSVVRGKKVAMDILRFTNPARPALQPVEVASWWWHLAPELHARMSDNIDFTASLTPGLTVLADRAQLSQIFTHLVSNARDAMPRGGRLQVTARSGRAGETFAFGVVPHAERFVYFAVEDSGSGMSDSVLTHIFDPLFTTKQNAGTGLGLAFAHQAVAAHGGQIFAESTFGAGSTFHVFIPHACLDFEHHNDCGDPT